MGTHLVLRTVQGQHALYTQKVFNGDLGWWVEELLFGYRISCTPPSPEKLVFLIGIRPLAKGREVHYLITEPDCTHLSAAAFCAVAGDRNADMACLHLSQQHGHLHAMYSYAADASVETPRPSEGESDAQGAKSSKKVKRATSPHPIGQVYEEEEEGDPESDEEMPGFFRREDVHSDDEYIINHRRVSGKQLKRPGYKT